MANETTVQDKLNSDALFVCDGLVKIYKSSLIEVMALQGLDLVVYKGEIVSVIGKSGSGKSTLMNIIGGLEKPSAGKIYMDGKDMTRFTEKDMMVYRKKRVGFVWQKSARNLFFYLTALENVEIAMSFEKRSAKAKRERALYLLKLVGIDHKKDSFPSQMSGGEQQRVAIAVALANEPEVLLADEPTGAVDTKTADSIMGVFRTLNKELGLTIIMVTHDMRMAEQCDRMIMISDGKISTEKVEEESYSVMDKANRVQLDKEMLQAAGIDSNKVKVTVEDGRIIITKK